MERIMAVVTIKETSSAIFCFGANAQVPGGRDANLYGGEDVIDIGLGMKPALTGKGIGKRILPSWNSVCQERV